MEFIRLTDFPHFDSEEFCVDPNYWGMGSINKDQLDHSDFRLVQKTAEEIEDICIATINGKVITEPCRKGKSTKFVLFNAKICGYYEHHIRVVTYSHGPREINKFWYDRYIIYLKGSLA